jgi:hypothetical protein
MIAIQQLFFLEAKYSIFNYSVFYTIYAIISERASAVVAKSQFPETIG